MICRPFALHQALTLRLEVAFLSARVECVVSRVYIRPAGILLRGPHGRVLRATNCPTGGVPFSTLGRVPARNLSKLLNNNFIIQSLTLLQPKAPSRK